jgi:hypothetical protein
MSLFIKTSLLGDGIHHMPALSPKRGVPTSGMRGVGDSLI